MPRLSLDRARAAASATFAVSLRSPLTLDNRTRISMPLACFDQGELYGASAFLNPLLTDLTPEVSRDDRAASPPAAHKAQDSNTARAPPPPSRSRPKYHARACTDRYESP